MDAKSAIPPEEFNPSEMPSRHPMDDEEDNTFEDMVEDIWCLEVPSSSITSSIGRIADILSFATCNVSKM